MKKWKKLIVLNICLWLGACSSATNENKQASSAETDANSTLSKEETQEKNFTYNILPNDTWSCPQGYSHDATHKNISWEANQEVVFGKDAIYLAKEETYEISFRWDSESDIQGTLLLQDEEGHVLVEKTWQSNSEQKLVFNSMQETWSAHLEFRWQAAEKGQAQLQNFQLQNPAKGRLAGRINQLGYSPTSLKLVSFSLNAGDSFSVIDLANQQVVYRGLLGNGMPDEKNGEYNYIGDFSALKTPGNYRILSETGLETYAFTITENPYSEVYRAALRFFTLQRSGIDLKEEVANELAHPASHRQEAYVYNWELKEKKDAWGGWYDAGDYGRYVQTTVKAVVPLLISYDLFRPTEDQLGLPESGNHTPDILDEARWGLEWLLRMLREDGLPYNKLTTKKFAGNIAPEEDKADLFLLPPWSRTTTAFAGTAAYAAILYREIDSAFAQQLQEAAERLGEMVLYVKAQANYNNPEDFATGQYNDESEGDERLFALAALFALTGKQEYRNAAEALFLAGEIKGSPATNLQEYGEFLLWRYGAQNTSFAKKLSAHILTRADGAEAALLQKNYPYPLNEYLWGSNQHVTEVIFQLELAHMMSGQQHYHQAAEMVLSYLLGQNALNMSFVCGFGSQYPQHIHSRLAYAKNALLPGALVGGVDQLLSDDANQLIPENTPVGKRYVDAYDSYSTNEVAIAYNGSFVLALSFFQNKK